MPASSIAVIANHLLRMLLYFSLDLRPPLALVRSRHGVNAARKIAAFATRRHKTFRRAGSYFQLTNDRGHRLIDRNVVIAVRVAAGTIQNLLVVCPDFREFLPRMHLQQWP